MLTRQAEYRLNQESIAPGNQNLSFNLLDEMFEFTGARRFPIKPFHRVASKGCPDPPTVPSSAEVLYRILTAKLK